MRPTPKVANYQHSYENSDDFPQVHSSDTVSPTPKVTNILYFGVDAGIMLYVLCALCTLCVLWCVVWCVVCGVCYAL